jgi:hypothetical protein
MPGRVPGSTSHPPWPASAAAAARPRPRALKRPLGLRSLIGRNRRRRSPPCSATERRINATVVRGALRDWPRGLPRRGLKSPDSSVDMSSIWRISEEIQGGVRTRGLHNAMSYHIIFNAWRQVDTIGLPTTPVIDRENHVQTIAYGELWRNASFALSCPSKFLSLNFPQVP